MTRQIITIENNTVALSSSDVWMSLGEIADLFGVPGFTVAGQVKAILKSGVLKEYKVSKCIRLDGNSHLDLYNMELITALAFRIDSRNAALFRRWLIEKATASPKTETRLFVQFGGRFTS